MCIYICRRDDHSVWKWSSIAFNARNSSMSKHWTVKTIWCIQVVYGSLGWSSPSNSGSHFLGGSELKAWRVSSLEGPGLSYISNRGLFETEQHLDSNMPDMQHHLTQQNHWPNVGGKRGFSQAKQQRCGASSTICTNAMAWDLVEMLRKSKRKMTEVFGHVTKRWGYHGTNINSKKQLKT